MAVRNQDDAVCILSEAKIDDVEREIEDGVAREVQNLSRVRLERS